MVIFLDGAGISRGGAGLPGAAGGRCARGGAGVSGERGLPRAAGRAFQAQGKGASG
jgi:hypothetical protein